MTNTVLLKRSATANSAPSAGSLLYGELAINYADGNLYYLNSANAVTVIASNKTVSLSGNITAGNILTSGLISATGNITGKYFLGNANIQYTASTAPTTGNLIGAQWYNTSTDALYEWQTDGTSSYWVDITGPVIGSTGAATGSIIVNGTSNVSIPVANGNAGINIGGTANVAVFATTGVYITGVVSATGNITGGNILGGANVNATTHTGTTVSVTGNITGGNILGGANVNATTHTGTTVSVTGNITGGNILTIGTISATGATNSTGFAVGNSAVSNVALGYFPTAGTAAEMAIRDYSTVASTMYFDNSIGGANVNGSFQFRASSAYTQWAKIDQYGVTQPTRPAFRVYGNTSTNFTANTTLTNQVVDYNQGSNYVNSTGVFTAPAPGLYQVWLNARAGTTASLSQIAVLKNNDNSGSNVICFWEITTSATQTTHFGVSSVAKLAAGDTLRAKVLAGGVNFDSNDNWGAAFIG